MIERFSGLSIRERLQAESHEVRQCVLEIMDELFQPMLRYEIEDALRPSGLSRSQRRKIAQVLKNIPIIAIGEH